MVTSLNMTGSYTVTTSWLVITTLMSAAALDGNTAGGHCQPRGTICNCVDQELTSFNSSACPLNTTELDLTHNNLTVLHDNMFTGLVHLKEIYFDYNRIVFIEKHAFTGLLNLTVLRLTNNSLSYLHPDMIHGNPSMRELHLKNNSIEIPECGPLLKSESLEVLGLEWCAIDSLVRADAFSQLTKLRTLNLSGNILNMVDLTSFQPLIKPNKTEIIHISGTCSEAFRETVIQLNDKIQFTDNCNVTTTTTEAPFTSIQPKEFVQYPFDINFIIASTVMAACVLVIILVVYVCFVQCTRHCRRRPEEAMEKRPRNTMENSPIRDLYNNGYLLPRSTPRTELDDIHALPIAIPPYIEVLPDEVPKQSHETADLDGFPFKTRLEREDSSGSTTPLLRQGSHNAGTTPPDGYTKMDATFNYPQPTPSAMVVIDGTKESKEHKNKATSLRSLIWVDNEQATTSHPSLHPPTVPHCRMPKQDLGIGERPLPPLPPRPQPSEVTHQPGITTTTPLPLPTRNAIARQHPLTALGGKLCFN